MYWIIYIFDLFGISRIHYCCVLRILVKYTDIWCHLVNYLVLDLPFSPPWQLEHRIFLQYLGFGRFFQAA